uniref:Uncharacterized protein n=1 Tax=viral metagenome TaxID=1070528 RepID=A0A6M3JRC7_9ZZZZ
MGTEKGTITMAYKARLGPGSISSLGEGGAVVGMVRVSQLAVTLSGSYNTSGSAVRAHLFTSPDNSNWDTDPFYSFDNATGTPPTLKRKTKAIDTSPMFLKAKLENLAKGVAIINAKAVATVQRQY